ncbi:hypothetical protein TRFO_19222 [Tritrichomonas foetus]|uniref:Ras-GAP domain-containing protein n=1 Tax=Tritrichomonas foetus TaxID=1144522 RepID=A0A1J4KK67_9EUKA|nr:hypothetical protein TRFO_19222 [Tritrichomonas foetus]|eukprot:OHT11344.1 hypothetical protein TRFO_19222 [Tritrichomonas foetus]
MENEITLPFLYPDSFCYLPCNPQFTYSPPEAEFPDLSPNSPFSSNLTYFKQLPDLLKDLYEMHINNNNAKLYLDTTNFNQEFSIKITQVSQISRNVIPIDLLEKTANISCLTNETIFQYFLPEQSYALIHILYHFRALAETPELYTTLDLRKRLFSKLLYYLTPTTIMWTCDFPIVSVMKVENRVGVFKKKCSAIVNFVSNNQITISTDSIYSQYEKANYISYAQESGKLLLHILDSNSSPNGVIPSGSSNNITNSNTTNLGNNEISLVTSVPNIWRDFTRARPPMIFSFTEAIICSLTAFPPTEEISVQLLDSFIRMILTLDYNFNYAFFQAIDCDATNGKHMMDSLNIIFSVFGQKLRLMKTISYFEVISHSDLPNQIFRGNSPSIKLLVEMMNEELNEFLCVTIASAFLEIAKMPSFDEKNPQTDDIEIVDKLLTTFWEIVIPAIEQIPQIIRSILRYHRLICELTFGSPVMNQRALSGLFILRIIVPAFTSLQKVGLPAEAVDQAERKKCTTFSKILMALGTLGSDYSAVTGWGIFDPVLQKHAKNMVLFFEKITEPVDNDPCECVFSLQDLYKAIQSIRAFVSANADQIRSKVPPEFHPSIFLYEAISCIVTQNESL